MKKSERKLRGEFPGENLLRKKKRWRGNVKKKRKGAGGASEGWGFGELGDRGPESGASDQRTVVSSIWETDFRDEREA